ncbi:MAG: universal stress protein [Calditrichia bacterium]
MEIKKILCPVDFSENSKKALEYAVFVATAHQSEIVLLHVIEGPKGLDQHQILLITPEEIAHNLEKSVMEELNGLADEIGEKVAIEKVVRQGKAFVEIIREAREKDVDLIVIGSHGKTGIPHMLLGSVVERVVRKSSCPVLVVRNKDIQFDMP